MRRLLRLPLVHFLAGGAALFAVVRGAAAVRGAPTMPAAAVVITAADVAQLRRDHARDAGVEPSSADEAGLVDRAIDEELLFREALARGLDQDRSVRNWLVEQMRVLDPNTADTPEQLHARACALGLDRTDLVVRRMLVQKMRLLAAREGERPPSDDELRAFLSRHGADYLLPDRVTLWHVFLGGAGRPETARAAAELLAELRRDAVAPADAVRRGDTFAAPPYLRNQSAADLRRRFGTDLAGAIADAPTGAWTGPVASPYGLHLVWIESRTPGGQPDLETVRGQLRERWLEEARARRFEATLRALKARYPLRVESAAWHDRHHS